MKLRERIARVLLPPVKESIDNLPVGVCCYWPGGLLKLTNRSMDALSFAIFGEALMDGEGFWRGLKTGEGMGEWLESGETPVVRLPDGTVRRFRHSTIELEDMPLHVVIADDLTEEYARSAVLAEKRERVEAMVERQRALNREIGTMVREREILNLKIRVHDDFSRALLSGRQYLAHPDPAQRGELQRAWAESVRILHAGGADAWHDSYENARETARALGLTLDVQGDLPAEKTLRELISSALVTCLTNAMRHAGADTVTARLGGGPRAVTLTVTNNGVPPSCEIAETGGLADLRRRVEAAGGEMHIQSAPRFALTLTLPREETNHGL